MIGLNSNSGTETKTLEFAPFRDVDTTTGGGTGAYFESGTYSVSNLGESTVGSYSAISNQSGADNDVTSESALWNNTVNKSQNVLDARMGSRTVTLGSPTSDTANFLTLTTASTTRTYNETSNQWVPPSVSGSVWNDWGPSGADGTPPPAASGGGPNSNGQQQPSTGIPWYFRPYKFDRSSTAKGDLETWPSPYLPGAISSTAQVSETTTATTTVTGQATTTGTGTTVNSNFTTSTTFNDSATLSAQSPAGFSPCCASQHLGLFSASSRHATRPFQIALLCGFSLNKFRR